MCESASVEEANTNAVSPTPDVVCYGMVWRGGYSVSDGYVDNATFSTQEEDGGANGGAIYSDYTGVLTFEGAAVFTGNEVMEQREFDSLGLIYWGGRGGAIYAISDEDSITFKGPVTVSGNKAKVTRA